MPFVVLWSDIAQGSCRREVQAYSTFGSIFVPARKEPAQIQVYPISSGRRLLADRQLSLRCIPSHPALPVQQATLLHRSQARSLFPRTSRWLLLKEPSTL